MSEQDLLIHQDDVSTVLLRPLIRYLLFGFGSVAIIHPFEVIMTLKQVQFIPIKKSFKSLKPSQSPVHSNTRLEQAEEYLRTKPTNTENEIHLPIDAMGYLVDSEYPSNNIQTPFIQAVILPSRISLDDVQEPSEDDESTAVLSIDAITWTDFLYKFVRTQGFFSIWKGLNVGFIHQLSRLFFTWIIQSKLEGYFLRTIPPSYLSDFQCDALSIITSHLLVSWILSPLELLRIRLIVQSSLDVEQKYKHWILGNLSLIATEEGGIWTGLYSRHSILTICYHACLPLIRQLPLYYISSKMSNLDQNGFSLLGKIGTVLLSWTLHAAYLIVSLPLETCRRRIFVHPIIEQYSLNSRTKKRAFPFITCVHLRPLYYGDGMFRTIHKICMEEGFGALYRGWTLKLGSNTTSLFLMLAQEWTILEEDSGSIDTI